MEEYNRWNDPGDVEIIHKASDEEKNLLKKEEAQQIDKFLDKQTKEK